MTLPPHGNPSRYKNYGCRCMSCCTRVNSKSEYEGPQSWPIRYLFKQIDRRIVEDDFGSDLIKEWTKNGIEDFNADRVSIHYRMMPSAIWPGYLEAADYYEEDEVLTNE
jgi:hypothetical protein